MTPAAAPQPAEPSGEHLPVLLLCRDHPTGGGYNPLGSFAACSCGQLPAIAPPTLDGRDGWYQAHRAALGLHPVPLTGAVYGPGYPAEGLTWKRWHDANPGVNPFTAEVY